MSIANEHRIMGRYHFFCLVFIAGILPCSGPSDWKQSGCVGIMEVLRSKIAYRNIAATLFYLLQAL